MSRTTDVQSRVTLAGGGAASALTFSGALGPMLTWPNEPLFIEMMTVFLLPIAAATIYGLIRALRPPCLSDEDTSHRAIDSIVFSVMCFLMGVHAILLAVLLQVDEVSLWAGRAVVVALGVTLMTVGNLLPRTRPNAAVGIRTWRTLDDRQLWMMTHRVTGYVMVAVGLLTVASGLVLTGTTVAALPGVAGAVGVALVAAYYWRVSRVAAARHI